MTIQSGSPAATQKAQLVDANGNPLGTNTNQLYTSQLGTASDTLPLPTQTNIVPSRTDIVTFTSADLTTPAFTVALFVVHITAVSGSSPTLTVAIQTKDSAGAYATANGGAASSALNSVSNTALAFSISNNSAALLLGPVYRVLATIGGGTPSFTWYLDIIYK